MTLQEISAMLRRGIARHDMRTIRGAAGALEDAALAPPLDIAARASRAPDRDEPLPRIEFRGGPLVFDERGTSRVRMVRRDEPRFAALRTRLAQALRHERHASKSDSAFWCEQYKRLAIEAIEGTEANESPASASAKRE